MELTIVHVGVAELKPSEYNPRQASEKEHADLKQSIERFGFVDPLIVNGADSRKNVVIGGHFRLRIAIEMGMAVVPVVYVNIPDEARERELNLRLNKNVGSWDYELLKTFDEKLLLDVGFKLEEINFNMGMEDAFAGLKNTEKGELEQMTFTFTAEEKATVEDALRIALALLKSAENAKPSNGQALSHICETYKTQAGNAD